MGPLRGGEHGPGKAAHTGGGGPPACTAGEGEGEAAEAHGGGEGANRAQHGHRDRGGAPLPAREDAGMSDSPAC
eukprot:5062975-Pyramimonas_sp.AAC.1